jgi:hypothetical protein
MDGPLTKGRAIEKPCAARRRMSLRIWSLGLLLLCLSVAGYFLYRSYAGEDRLRQVIAELDRTDPGWRLEDLEARRIVVPEAEDSALRVAAVKRLLPWGWDQALNDAGVPFYEAPPAQLNEFQTELLTKELKKVRPAVAEARKLVDQPHGHLDVRSGLDWFMVGARASHFDGARAVVMLLRYDAALRSQEGDADGALASIRGALNAGRSVHDDPALVAQLIRNAYCLIALSGLERALAQGEPSEAALSGVQSPLDEEGAQPRFLIGAQGELALTNEFMNALRAGKVSTSQLVQIAQHTQWAARNPTGAKIAGLDIDQELYRLSLRTGPAEHAALLEYLSRVVQIARLPTREQVPRLHDLESTLVSQPTIVKLLAGWESRVADQSRRTQALLRCAAVGVAAERYRRAHGRWPASLAALVPDYLRSVPTDPYDGKPIRLSRRIDGIVVYAVGPDGRDDGGIIERKHFRITRADVGFQLWDPAYRRQPPLNPSIGPPRPEDDDQ